MLPCQVSFPAGAFGLIASALPVGVVAWIYNNNNNNVRACVCVCVCIMFKINHISYVN